MKRAASNIAHCLCGHKETSHSPRTLACAACQCRHYEVDDILLISNDAL